MPQVGYSLQLKKRPSTCIAQCNSHCCWDRVTRWMNFRMGLRIGPISFVGAVTIYTGGIQGVWRYRFLEHETIMGLASRWYPWRKTLSTPRVENLVGCRHAPVRLAWQPLRPIVYGTRPRTCLGAAPTNSIAHSRRLPHRHPNLYKASYSYWEVDYATAEDKLEWCFISYSLHMVKAWLVILLLCIIESL